MLSGFGFLLGTLRDEDWEVERLGAGGMAEEDRREGFLCVWLEGSTFRRWDVTSEPREIWSKTAPMSVVLGKLLALLGGSSGGESLSKEGKGGGGGGAAAAYAVGDRDI